MPLYRIVPHYFKHADPRGTITGLINTGIWREANLVTSEAGVTRGRHFHKHTEECFVILSGRISVSFKKPTNEGSWLTDEQIFAAGDVFIVHKGVEHVFVILEDATWINFLSIPVDQANPDFHRYP